MGYCVPIWSIKKSAVHFQRILRFIYWNKFSSTSFTSINLKTNSTEYFEKSDFCLICVVYEDVYMIHSTYMHNT